MKDLLANLTPELAAIAVTSLVTLLLGYKSQLDGWSSQNPRIAGLLKIARSVSFDVFMLRQGLTLVVAGRLPKDLTEPSKPKDPPDSGDLTGTRISIKPKIGSNPPGAAMVGWACLMAILLCSGCAGSLEAARSSGASARSSGAVGAASQDRCAALDDKHRLWGGLAKGFALAAGGTGLSTIPVDDRDARIALAAGAVVAGIGAATSTYLSESAAESYARDCSAR